MTDPKIRKFLVLAHLYFAGFLAPAFLLVAVSGGLYLIGNKGEFASSPVNLPANATLDFKSPTLEADVRALFKAGNIEEDFEYIKDRGTKIQTRPTSREYIEIAQTDEGLTATRKTPNLQGSLMELHKGHGPKLFKTYQKLVALGLMGVVFGGIFVGLLAAGYRRKTIIASVIGLITFIVLAFIV